MTSCRRMHHPSENLASAARCVGQRCHSRIASLNHNITYNHLRERPNLRFENRKLCSFIIITTLHYSTNVNHHKSWKLWRSRLVKDVREDCCFWCSAPIVKASFTMKLSLGNGWLHYKKNWENSSPAKDYHLYFFSVLSSLYECCRNCFQRQHSSPPLILYPWALLLQQYNYLPLCTHNV